MAPSQSLLWTALPNDLTEDETGLRLSVLLSPRLAQSGSDPTLSSFFPDWRDWPTTLSRATFKIFYDDPNNPVSIPATQTTGVNRVDGALGLPDPNCWRALFTDTLPVHSYAYEDYINRFVLSYDTTGVASMVEKLYATLAANATGDMPLVSDIADESDWSKLVDAVKYNDMSFTSKRDRNNLRDPRAHFEWFTGQRERDSRGLGPDVLERADMLARFQLFHTPPATPKPVTWQREDDERVKAQWLEYERATLPDETDIAPSFDFHQMVAAMNSYPTLLRRLGLVVDFIVDKNAFRRLHNGLLWVSAEFPPGALAIKATHASPRTHTELTADKFRPIANPSPGTNDHRVVDRLLDLDPDRFDVLQMDVDGAGHKVTNFARTLGRFHEAGSDTNVGTQTVSRVDTVTRFEKELGAPALRTAGLMLVQKSRSEMLKDKFTGNAAKNAALEGALGSGGTPPELWAEDVLRGFRVDIWDGYNARWLSLCQRHAAYVLGDDVEVIPTQPEETTVRLAVTHSSDPASNQNVLYLHEALVSWAGWSLAAPMPGRAVDKDDNVDESTTQTTAALPPGIKFKSEFRVVPGSLPRLRFGRSYWMRARAVDLAGNSLAPKTDDFGPEDPVNRAHPYLRYEPVGAPIIALVGRRGLKTKKPGEGESIARIVIRSFNDTPADNTKVSKQTAQRFAVPPQSSVRDAEQHGKLDSGLSVDGTTFNMLANQKDRDAQDPKAALIEEIIQMQGPLDVKAVDTHFAVYRDGEALTYLPDPLANEVGVRIFDHPNIKDSDLITVPLYASGQWPEAQPFKIKVYEDSAKPHFDQSTHTLMVPLPKGVRAKVRLSMKLTNADLKTLGVFRWLGKHAQAKLSGMARNGQHWMLTPWHTVEVVHAVQRPLIAPAITPVRVERYASSTSALPMLEATCSLKSTDRVDLLAEWHEPQDDPGATDSAAQQIDVPRNDFAFAVKIKDAKSYSSRVGNPLGGFPDHSIEGPDLIGINLQTEKLRLTPKAHEFHDTRYRRIVYHLDATTKFREFLPQKILTDGGPDPIEKNIKVSGAPAVTWVPSSAPPPTPKILYVVPTYGWERSESGNVTSSWRRGGGLRVYLDRPWNATGYGEMLAVVLPPATFDGDPETEPNAAPYKRSVTQWGNDPIWLSPFVSGIAPKRTNFPLARTAPDPTGAWLPVGAPADESDQQPGNFQVTGLNAPADNSLAPVEAAPHDVFYDPDRQLWYCDIEVDHGASYYPFIRLALARYQPTSIRGAHLSNVVLADFMTLAADRWLSVTRTNATSCHVSVYGNRYSDSSGHAEASHAPSMSLIDPITRTATSLSPASISPTTVVEVWLEHLDAAEGEDFGWKRVPSSARPSTRPAKKAAQGAARAKKRAQSLLARRDYGALLKERLVDKVFVVQPIWDGDVTLPAASGPHDRYRLVIGEYEEYIVDDDRPYDRVPTKKGRRLVFVEHVEVSAS